MTQKIGFSDAAHASIRSKIGDDNFQYKENEASNLIISGWCKVVCRDSEGNVKWVDEGPNRVVDTGISYILGTAILDTATLYVGLTDGTPTIAAGDTMASHVGWLLMAGYDEATRPLWGQDAEASQAVTNSTSADFTMDGTDTTIGGAFITTDNTKDGTAGTLVAVKEFTGGDKTVANNDVLSVTYTITGSSS